MSFTDYILLIDDIVLYTCIILLTLVVKKVYRRFTNQQNQLTDWFGKLELTTRRATEQAVLITLLQNKTSDLQKSLEVIINKISSEHVEGKPEED